MRNNTKIKFTRRGDLLFLRGKPDKINLFANKAYNFGAINGNVIWTQDQCGYIVIKKDSIARLVELMGLPPSFERRLKIEQCSPCAPPTAFNVSESRDSTKNEIISNCRAPLDKIINRWKRKCLTAT